MSFDIAVIGGGHAGVEAAYISSQFSDLKIAIITMPGIGLGSAPCNPSIGGVGKGQVVREIDSLGGLTGKLADKSGLQFRTLNESKGYAVQSTRIQIDKDLYSINAEEEIAKIKNIQVIREKVLSFEKTEQGYKILTESSTWNSKKVIMTVGTFLNGKMHTGSDQFTGGRFECESSDSLNDIFKDIKTISARFKTGTPARLDKDSIDYSVLEEQPSDSSVQSFHWMHDPTQRFIEQKSCYLAYTNEKTLKIIRDNKEKSPMFNGQINGVGARYCPSIEDKAYRYPDKNIHHVFIEPEGLNMQTVYPSGISTSLPRDIQDQMMSSIVGLENASILNYGYAVEYDVVDTTRLSYSLEHKDLPGLHFAGQVNGTSGYEEAAGQGLIAGANTALALLGKDPLILSRSESYIGVMIEDLISNVRDEPYRLFTARSENRLYIREDNALLRMADSRAKLGLNHEIDQYIYNFQKEYTLYKSILENFYVNGNEPFFVENNIKVPRRTMISEVIKQSTLDPVETLLNFFKFNQIIVDTALVRCLAITLKYEGYINKSNEQMNRLNKLNKMKISWSELCNSENISFECKQRIEVIKPETFGQLKLIEGLRPATLAVVASQSI